MSQYSGALGSVCSQKTSISVMKCCWCCGGKELGGVKVQLTFTDSTELAMKVLERVWGAC